MSRSKNVRLTPVQRGILWTIEEAGAENLITVWVTVRPEHPSMSDEQFHMEFVEGLLGLGRLGYLRLLRERQTPNAPDVELPPDEANALWLEDIPNGRRDILVEMTDAGYQALGRPSAP